MKKSSAKSTEKLEPQTHGGALTREGGKREGAGRPSDKLKEKIQSIIEKKKLIEFLADVASGEPVEHKTVIGAQGVVKTMQTCDVKDRLRAAEMLLDRGYGKPAQTIESETLNNLARTFLIRPEAK